LCICLSARISQKPRGQTSPNFIYACCPRPWLGPSVAALRCIMYFRFFVDDVIFPYYPTNNGMHVSHSAASHYSVVHGLTPLLRGVDLVESCRSHTTPGAKTGRVLRARGAGVGSESARRRWCLLASRTSFTRSSRRCCRTSRRSRTRGSTCRRPSANTPRSTRNACRWRRNGSSRTNYRYVGRSGCASCWPVGCLAQW